MSRVLAHEAKRMARRAERHADRIAAADRPAVAREVIVTNRDDIRGDMVSLLLNAKPANLNLDQWRREIEARGGPARSTTKRWLDKPEHVKPQQDSCGRLLHAIGKAFYIGDL
jgi:hypothetical protein